VHIEGYRSDSPPSDPTRESIRSHLLKLGFDVVGFTSVAAPDRADYYRKWIAKGCHGDMEWMAHQKELREDPAQVMPEARTLIVVGLNYYQEPTHPELTVARYALGRDYHRLMTKRLKSAVAWMQQYGGSHRALVDTGPILEKPLGMQAGVGWQGKSTILIHRKLGTWLFLGEIITTLDLPADPPERDHCGTCTRCITACPTKAITAPYQLDARRCISYLTIELKGPIPVEFRRAIGNRVYGCDICLEVCPWNRWAQLTREADFQERPLPSLSEVLHWSTQSFEQHFEGSPVRRLGWNRWMRNVCVVAGNSGNRDLVPRLQQLAHHDDPLIAEHAQWALNELTDSDRLTPSTLRRKGRKEARGE